MSSYCELIRRLRDEALDYINRMSARGYRSPRIVDLFKRVMYISPDDIEVVNYTLRRPVAAFNPGAVLEDDGKTISIFPRLIFGYYWYVSSIGHFSVDIDELINGNIGKPLKVRIVLWPTTSWDLGGCEDPRVIKYGEEYIVLYTGVKPSITESHIYSGRPLQAIAFLDERLRVVRKGVFRLMYKGSVVDVEEWKDSSIIEIKGSKASLLTRLRVDDVRICWWCIGDLREFTVDYESLKPVFSTCDWEERVGWSTNCIKIGSNEYLIGWHGVSKEDLVYRNGLAIVSSDGELLATTDYILSPRELPEMYGDRSGVIFGDGLVLYKEYLIWIGGASDHCIGVFVTELDKVMEHMRWLRG